MYLEYPNLIEKFNKENKNVIATKECHPNIYELKLRKQKQNTILCNEEDAQQRCTNVTGLPLYVIRDKKTRKWQQFSDQNGGYRPMRSQSLIF